MSKKVPTSGPWTEEMDGLLRKLMARKASKKELMVTFPSKTYNALYLRMHKLRNNKTLAEREIVKTSISKPKIQENERKCMTCGQPFMSTGPGNRLCMTHRRESNDGTFAVKIR